MDSSSLLAELIDDYIAWYVDWHRVSARNGGEALPPPARFARWRNDALKSLSGEQPAIEHLTTLHEQLHTLVKLVLMKAAESRVIDPKDDDSIAAKYLELMRELRRFERAFAAAASNLDPLTGLRTRLSLPRDLEREIGRSARSKRPFFVAIMDVDHFKKINDSFGHDSGDRVLAAVADHISRGLRSHDDAYRLGGEEFLLSLKETDQTGSLQVLERLRAGLEKMPVVLSDGRRVPVTASFGLAASTKATTPDELLRHADAALYRAKHEGRNRIVVSD
jgi:diguanylate cyclase